MFEKLSLKTWAVVIVLIIILGMYSYYSFVPRPPSNTCVEDEDCVQRPCCHMCNTPEYADWLVDRGEYNCMPLLCVKPYECKCVEGDCRAVEKKT